MGALETGDGEIRDLGYARYQGARTAHAARVWVIARNVVSLAWHGGWRAKLPFYFAAGITLAVGVVLYVMRYRLQGMMSVLGSQFAGIDGVLLVSLEFYKIAGFLLAATVACTTVSNDLRTGSFLFYFSRALTRHDYLAGKILGTALVVSIPMLGGPLLLALFRLSFANDWSEVADLLPGLWRVIVVGLLGTLTYTLPPLGLSAVVQKRQIAQALWFVYYLVISPAAFSISFPLDLPWLRLIAVHQDLTRVAVVLFGGTPRFQDPSALVAGLALVAISAAGYWVLAWRLRSLETAGIGGA